MSFESESEVLESGLSLAVFPEINIVDPYDAIFIFSKIFSGEFHEL